jgi:hypothetical protein
MLLKGTDMELTEEQRRKVCEVNGDPIMLTDPETQQEYVLLRADVYERLKRLVYDDSPPTDEEKRRQLAESGKRAGWDDPKMAVYDNYDENLKKL